MITEALLGTLTGILGNILSSFVNLRAQRLKNEHELAMVKAQTEATIKEAEANIRVTETRVAGEIEAAETLAFSESIRLGNQRELGSDAISGMLNGNLFMKILGTVVSFLQGLVDVLRASMRPALTAYLVGVASYLTWKAWNISGVAGTEVMAGVFASTTEVMVYMAVTCVTWWFGDRRVAKFMYRLNDGNLRN